MRQRGNQIGQLLFESRRVAVAAVVFHLLEHGVQLQQCQIARSAAHAVNDGGNRCPVAILREAVQLWHTVLLLCHEACPCGTQGAGAAPQL